MRFVKLLSVTVIAAAFVAALVFLSPDLCFSGGESYTFYCGESSKNCREITVRGGAAFAKALLSDVCGESTEYGELDVYEYLASVNGEIIFTEELSDSVNYYCKADLPYSVTLYGESINLHICVKNSGVKVASPIIFGGY